MQAARHGADACIGPCGAVYQTVPPAVGNPQAGRKWPCQASFTGLSSGRHVSKHDIVRCLAAIGAFMCLADPGLAQERPGSIYVTGGVVAPYQTDQTGASNFGAPGGRTASWLVGVGVFVSPRLSIESETWSTGVMSSVQSFRGSWLESARGPDRFVSFALKGHIPLFKAVRLEPVGGFVLLLPADISATYYDIEGKPSPRSTTNRDTHIGVMFGGDLRIGGRHIAVVPSLRFAIAGGGAASSPYPAGYPSWTQRPSLSLMVSF